MTYKSPLHLIPEEYHADLSVSTLKKVKKKLLLRLQLESKTTLEINGQEYDKNQLLAAFEELGNQPDFHLKLYQNKPLLHFIETGALNIFNQNTRKLNWQDIPDENRDYTEWLLGLFSRRLSEVYLKYLKQLDEQPHSLEVIKKIWNSGMQLPPKYENIVYGAVHQFLKSRMDSILSRYSIPVEGDNPLKLKRGIENYVGIQWVQIHRYLPGALEAVKDEYCRWNKTIINHYFSEEKTVSKIPRNYLHTLEQAASVVALAYGEEKYQALARYIRNLLSNSVPTGSRRKNEGVLRFLFVFFSFFVILYPSYHYFNKSSRFYQTAESRAIRIQDETHKKVRQKMARKYEVTKVVNKDTMDGKSDREISSIPPSPGANKTAPIRHFEANVTILDLEPVHLLIADLSGLCETLITDKAAFLHLWDIGDYYLNINYTARHSFQIQRNITVHYHDHQYEVIPDTIPEVTSISYDLSRPFKIYGKASILNQKFTFNATIDKPANRIQIRTNIPNKPVESHTFELAPQVPLSSQNALSPEMTLAHNAITSYLAMNGKEILPEEPKLTGNFYGYAYGKTMDVPEDLTIAPSPARDLLLIKNEYYTEIPIDINLYYDPNTRMMVEYHIEIFSKSLSFNTVDMWAYL